MRVVMVALLLSACSSSSSEEPPAGGSMDVGAEVAADSGSMDAAAEPDEGPASPDVAPVDVPEDVDPGPDPAEGLTLAHLQVKGTHNSYHIEPPNNELPDWDYTMAPLDQQLGEYGVRQVELDIHLDDEGTYRVFHIPVLDELTTCETFAECLGTLKTWSDNHPKHHVLFVLVEPKDDLDINKIDDYEKLDAAILAVWPRERVVTPDDVRGDHATLRQALETDGWPAVSDTRGKALFVMLDGGAHRDAYLDGRPSGEGRVIFARGGEGEPYGAILEIGRDQPEAIKAAAEAGYLVRTTVNDSDAAGNVIAAGAHIISTDYPAEAAAADSGFFLDIPSGAPSGCNPVTAPESCDPTTLDLSPPPTR